MKKNIEKPETIKASAARYKGESTEILIHDAAGDIPEYIYYDPEIYTDDARATLESLPRRDRERFINGLLEKFYYKNPEYAAFVDEIFNDPAKLLNFFKAIKLKDFERAGVPLTGDILPQVVNRYEETQKNIESAEKETANIKDLEAATLKEKWPILRLRDIFTESELAAFYYLQHPRQEIRRPETIATPLDKTIKRIFNTRLSKDNTKKLLEITKTAHKENAPEVHVNALVYFDNDIIGKYNLSKELNSFDLLVASSIYSIYRENHDTSGHCITTLTAIHNAISKTRAASYQLEKYMNSLKKQRLTTITIDNKEEADAYNYEYYQQGSAALLEMREVTNISRHGKITDAAIEILDAPAIFSFLEQTTHQLTDIPAEVYKSGISMTPKNLDIQSYLIGRIAPERNKLKALEIDQKKHYTKDRQKKINRCKKFTILINTLLENIGRTKRRDDKQRVTETAMEYLNHFSKVHWIEAAKLSQDKNKITVILPLSE